MLENDFQRNYNRNMKKDNYFRKRNSISGMYRKVKKCSRIIVACGVVSVMISTSALPAYAIDFNHLFDFAETKKESDLFHFNLQDSSEKDDKETLFTLIFGKDQSEEGSSNTKSDANTESDVEAKSSTDTKSGAKRKNSTDQKNSVEVKSSTDAMSSTDTKNNAEVKSGADTKNDTEAKSDVEAKNSADTKSVVEAESDIDTKSESDTKEAAAQDAKDKSGKNTKIPAEYKISDFDIVYQSPELPTGCEITAATMLLNYYGFDVEKTTMAKKYLPLTSYSTYYKNGVKYGADMYNNFVGDPASASSGVICGPGAILKAINSYFSDLEKTSQTDSKSDTQEETKAESKTDAKSDTKEETKSESKTDSKDAAKEEIKSESSSDIKEDIKNAAVKYKPVDISGSTPEDLYKRVSNDQPCLVWVTISMQTRPAAQDSWTTEEGKKVDWTRADHCAVLVGYSKDKVYIADPISGMVEYSRTQFEKVYKSRNQMSLVLDEKN